MKFNAIAVAAVLAATGLQASAAALTSQTFDNLSSTFSFGATRITGEDTAFNFVLNLGGGEAGQQQYTVKGDISATNFSFSSVTLNGTAWTLSPSVDGTYLGLVRGTFRGPLEVEIAGSFTGPSDGYGNLQGSLVLAPVPEPETYALMLAGLAAVGFAARRRRH
ncbi:FxDxF family PEP-CTERM protein [Aquincola sp. J276]|nr:FxDxF family PEP-CTERM protein [Aquincola sp. J276]MCR5864188.1 FxDxF family PEP-CTERM protein [Aquincola sp. J276]